MKRLILVISCLGLAACSTAAWRPSPTAGWQIQFAGAFQTTTDAQLFDLDLYDTPAEQIATLHHDGSRVICYFSAGTFEPWRPDASAFPAAMLGKAVDGWPDERWLDVRNDALRPLLAARLDLAAAQGCDGIDADNVDGFTNDTGFPLESADQLAFNSWLAGAAHARGLAIGLKNDIEQVSELADQFDWAMNESCFEYQECDRLRPFVQAGKAVLQIEYQDEPTLCGRADELGLDTIVKHSSLDAFRIGCKG